MGAWKIVGRLAGAAWLIAGVLGLIQVGIGSLSLAGGARVLNPGLVVASLLLSCAAAVVYAVLGWKLFVGPSGRWLRQGARLSLVLMLAFLASVPRLGVRAGPTQMALGAAVVATLVAYTLGRGRWPAEPMPLADRKPRRDNQGRPLARVTPIHDEFPRDALEVVVAKIPPAQFACFRLPAGHVLHVSRTGDRYLLEAFLQARAGRCMGGGRLRVRRSAESAEAAVSMAHSVFDRFEAAREQLDAERDTLTWREPATTGGDLLSS